MLHENAIRIVHPAGFSRPLDNKRMRVFRLDENYLPAEEVKGNDNRPAAAKASKPFSNLDSEPASFDVKLDGTYREMFSGTFYKDKTHFSLAPGEFVVLAH